MRFYSRIVLICNICFIISVVLRYIELSRRAHGNTNGAIPFQPLEATLVILGYGAVIVNALFFVLALYGLATKKLGTIPRWIILFNLLIFPVQVYYHFFLP